MRPYLENKLSLHQSGTRFEFPARGKFTFPWGGKKWIAQSPFLNAKHRLEMPRKPPICPSCDGLLPGVAQQQPTPAKHQKRNGALRSFSKTIYRGKKPFAWCGKAVGCNENCSLQSAARQFNIPWSTFRVFCKHPVNILRPTGHPPTLTKKEETLIANSAIELARNGTPLSRDGLKDLVQHFCERLPTARRATLPFEDLRPGDKFLSGFFKRNSALSLKRRCNLETDRAIAMSPTNIAEHYARLQQEYNEYGICSGAQIFNLDESGFSTKTDYRARAKGVTEASGRSNSIELKWSSNADHVTLMPIVSANDRAWDPVAIAPGKRAKYRIRPDGSRETPICYLPENARIIYRDPAGIYSDGFFQFCEWFIEQTAALRARHRNILLTLDGYGAHKTFKCLNLLRKTNIVVIALPAHSSHRTHTGS